MLQPESGPKARTRMAQPEWRDGSRLAVIYLTGVKTSNNHSRWTRRRQEMLQPESGPKARTRRRQEMLQPEIGARSVGLTAQQV
jgi:hypothetical protein